MSQALSIRSAARECPERTALIFENRHYNYQELGEMVASVEWTTINQHKAESALDTALRLYASLEAKRPLSLLSATATDTQVESAQQQTAKIQEANPALVLYTSGSSGESKGVLLSRDALVASAHAANAVLGWHEGDRWLCCLPLSHIGGLSVLLRCLVARRTAVLCNGFDASAVAGLLFAAHITHVSLVPTMLWRLLELGTRAPEQLRVVLMGGAAMDTALATRARRSGFFLRPSYGMTETASMVVCDGHALPGVELRLAEDQTLQIRAPMLMDGYLPPHDARSHLQDGWLRTQDRARRGDEGRLEILGRLDATIISGGENIDLGEIESELLRHEQVRACLAVGVPDPEWGQRLVVLVVCDGDVQTIECEGLQGYKRPKALLPVEALPLLENGKPDRRRAQLMATTELE